jgi:hypothetical protein
MFTANHLAGFRHADLERRAAQTRRDNDRLRWELFCQAWRLIGAAARNGYGPAGVR